MQLCHTSYLIDAALKDASEGNVDAIKRLEMYPVCICDSSGMKGRQNAGYIIKV